MTAAELEALRASALTWLRGQRMDDGKTEDIINGLLAALTELAERLEAAERERVAYANTTTDALVRAEAAESLNAELVEALERIAECAYPDGEWHRDKARSALAKAKEQAAPVVYAKWEDDGVL